MRNPKDVLTSAFYFNEMATHMVNPGPRGQFLHKFLNGEGCFQTYFQSMYYHHMANESHLGPCYSFFSLTLVI